MQPDIAMKSAGYVARILLWKYCKFGENIYYNSRDIEFFIGDYLGEYSKIPKTEEERPRSNLHIQVTHLKSKILIFDLSCTENAS